MSNSPAVPIRLPVNQFDHFYRGGNRIGALRHGPGGPRRPEEWLASTTSRFGEAPNGFTVLPDGSMLVEMVDKDPVAWLGADHVARYGSNSEVLIKLLDLDQRLPVHLHPNREFARSHLGLAHGKTEAWYVLDAPPGAKVGVGFAEAMDPGQVREWVMAEDSASLLSALRTREVRPGDAMLVPAGLPHTVQEGVFVLELQEPTDLSILLEWQDFAVDGFKDGHLDLGFDTVLGAVDYSAVSASDLDSLVLAREDIEAAGLQRAMPKEADQYFRLHRLHAGETPTAVEAGFTVVLITEGTGVITTQTESLEVQRGDAILLGHAVGNWTLHSLGASPCVAMVCRPPAPDAPEGAR